MAIELITLFPPIDLVNARHPKEIARFIGSSNRADRFELLNDGSHPFQHPEMKLPGGARIEILVEGGRGIYRFAPFGNAVQLVRGHLTPDGLMVDGHRNGGQSIRLPEDTEIHLIGGRFNGAPHRLYGIVQFVDLNDFDNMSFQTADRLLTTMSAGG